MARVRGTTAERGYGQTHRDARAAAIAAYRLRQPCARCGQPLYGDSALFDLGHDDYDRSRYTGLGHRSCNRGAEAVLGNQLDPRFIASTADRSLVSRHTASRITTPPGHVPSSARATISAVARCGAARVCAAGNCSGACGRELQRRNRLASGWLPREQRPAPPKPRQIRESNSWLSVAIAYCTCPVLWHCRRDEGERTATA